MPGARSHGEPEPEPEQGRAARGPSSIVPALPTRHNPRRWYACIMHHPHQLTSTSFLPSRPVSISANIETNTTIAWLVNSLISK